MYTNKLMHQIVILRISISHFIGLKVLLTLTVEAGLDPEKYTLTSTNTFTQTHTSVCITNHLAARNNTGTQEDTFSQ